MSRLVYSPLSLLSRGLRAHTPLFASRGAKQPPIEERGHSGAYAGAMGFGTWLLCLSLFVAALYFYERYRRRRIHMSEEYGPMLG